MNYFDDRLGRRYRDGTRKGENPRQAKHCDIFNEYRNSIQAPQEDRTTREPKKEQIVEHIHSIGKTKGTGAEVILVVWYPNSRLTRKPAITP